MEYINIDGEKTPKIGAIEIPKKKYDNRRTSLPVQDLLKKGIGIAESNYFLIDNLFSELESQVHKARARENLGIYDTGNTEWGTIIGNIKDQEDLVNYFTTSLENYATQADIELNELLNQWSLEINESPNLTGLPITSLPTKQDNSDRIASTKWVNSKINDIVINSLNFPIHFGNNPPETAPLPDHVWISPTNSVPFKTRERDADVAALFTTLAELKKQVDAMSYGFTHVMDPGGIHNNALEVFGGTPKEEPSWANDEGALEWSEYDDEYTGGFVDLEAEPDTLKDSVPNVRHLLIKAGTKEQLGANKDKLLPRELFFCEDTLEFYIKLKTGKLYKLNGASSSDPTIPTMPDLDNIQKITFKHITSNKSTIMEVKIDGSLDIYNPDDRIPETVDRSGAVSVVGYDDTSTKIHLAKLYINSLYCGGLTAGKNDYNPCSHNFVELSNLTGRDVKLDGLSLQYAVNGKAWQVLPLKGVIKDGSTFLIRGAQCGVMDTNTTKIKVRTFDMEWKDSSGELIKFDTTKSKFLLTHGVTPNKEVNPYIVVLDKTYVTMGYIDMIGLNIPGATSTDAIDGYEVAAYPWLSPDRMYLKYFTMDPVSQATKVLGKRNNSKDWYYIDLTKDIEYGLEEFYSPKSSYENKDIFYNKSDLDKIKPNMVTVTLGRDAHTTRCFNWVSVGFYDEFLSYRIQGTDDWTSVESTNDKVGVENIYNRVRVVATNGTPYTSHKYILNGLVPGTYEYKVGKPGAESDVYTFVVRSRESCSNFGFIHVSDQQGFNRNEYQVWRKVADKIAEAEVDSEQGTGTKDIHFVLNTGDMTQSGNRIHEWIDYYDAGLSLFSQYEQMNIIGNNDLSPEDFQTLGLGRDVDKMSPINFLFYYCYEIDTEFPPYIDGDLNHFVPSVYSFTYGNTFFLGVNSEITGGPEGAQAILYDNANFYRWQIEWCENVTAKAKRDPLIKNFISFTHEAPFTLVTQNQVDKEIQTPGTNRGGSKLNTEDALRPYSYSQFLQNNGFRLSLCGHKHTYTRSRPLIDDPENSMMPIIQDTDMVYYDGLSTEDKKLCQIQIVEKITAPIYVMSQASGYKLFSNKDIPAPRIPWLASYFPGVMKEGFLTNNMGQRIPMYIKWDVTNEGIEGHVYQVHNIMTNGTYNVNNPLVLPPTRENGDGEANEIIKIIN